MFQYYLPVLLIVGSNVFYHICAKSIPGQLNPMVGLIVTYLVGAVLAIILFYISDPSKDIISQFK